MNTYNKIIFVCMGNTCRSPMAATIMQNRLSKYDVIVESRGMVVLFEEPYNPKAVAVAASHNMIMPSNNAIQIANNDFGKDTLVLVMNASMKQKLYDSFDRAINVYTLCEFCGEPEEEVQDPYGKGIEEYNGKYICYSLGNFWFDEYNVDTMLVNIRISGNDYGDKIDVSVVPAVQDGTLQGCVTHICTQEEDKSRIFSLLNKVSINANVADDGTVTQVK